MSPQKLKKALQKELRAKRAKPRKAFWFGIILLLGLVAVSGSLLWYQFRPAALLQQGIRLEQQKNLAKALDIYALLVKDYVLSKEAEEALYRRGRIFQYDLGEGQKALLAYLQLEKDYPHSKFLILAQQGAAKLTKYRLENCEQAIPIYQRLLEETDGNSDQYQYEIADCYARMKNWTQASIEFETLLGSFPQSQLCALSAYRLAEAWLLIGQRDKARAGFEQVIKAYPRDSLVPEARFRLAEMLEEEEKLTEALRAYTRLIEYPRQGLLKQKIVRLKERISRKEKGLK